MYYDLTLSFLDFSGTFGFAFLFRKKCKCLSHFSYKIKDCFVIS